jgi:hypothetical protein
MLRLRRGGLRLQRLACAALCLLIRGSSPQAAAFDVTLVYGRAFDSACSRLTGGAIDPRGRAQLEARLPAMRERWAREGRPLLERAFRIAGKRPAGGLRTVRLTLCDIPSSSLLGAMVNMRHALPAFTDRPVPLGYKVAVIDHELLHPLLSELDLSHSRLLAAHRGEPWRVRRHLHLFALLKAALIEAGRRRDLAEIERIDTALPGRAYGRAWRIVEATPDAYRAYVEEVRLAR